MIEESVIIMNRTGLHARLASKFVQVASKFKSKITITVNDMSMDAKSIIALLSICISKGSSITIQADGEDEKLALNILILFIKKLAEEE